MYSEAISISRLGRIPDCADPPLPGIWVRRMTVSKRDVGFLVLMDGQAIGTCEYLHDLTHGREVRKV
jgi:hypothetical protein